MKENEKNLREAFFKKETYAEKMKKLLPQYEPMDKKNPEYKPGFGGIVDITKAKPFGIVRDTDEAAKRLQGFFGATVGINSVKNMASRSIKSFPIVISENVEPETAVMLKRLMEEQYAEYINLLISNKVVDVGAFEVTGTNKDQNIANQVLDIISSAETERQAMSRKAMTGKLDTDELMANTPLYSLLRQESVETGNVLFDTLFENAVVTTPENKDVVVKFMQEHMNEIVSLKEADPRETSTSTSTSRESRYTTFGDFAKENIFSSDDINKKITNRDTALDSLRGYTGARTAAGDPIFNKLSTPSLVVDAEQMREAMDKSIGELILDPKNFAIRDRFEKATFLLYANRISGGEYIDYLIQRLGIPIGSGVRAQLIARFPTHEVRHLENPNITINGQNLYDLQNNLRLDVTADRTLQALSNYLFTFNGNHYAAAGFYGRLSAGFGVASAGYAGLVSLGFLASNPIGWALLAAGGVGAAANALIQFYRHIRTERDLRRRRIAGWERVEALINAMDEHQKGIRKRLEEPKTEVSGAPENDELLKEVEPGELKNSLSDFNKRMDAILKKSEKLAPSLRESFVFDPNSLPINITEETASYIEENLNIFNEALAQDQEYQALVLSESLLQEKVVSQTFPVKLIKKYEYDTSAKPDVLVVPEFSTRSRYAYGSVEYERKDLKDRKYNTPLIMTVRFRERLADEKFSDNELVAVIGILGVITYVPSEEMEYILKSNIEGKTIRGILAADPAVGALASDLLGALDIRKMEQKISALPKSGEFWQNLEKVAKLSAVNKLAGRQSNNVANAHIVFSQKEIDNVKASEGVDYLRDEKLTAALMKRYGAFTLMIANDVTQRVYMFDDLDNISWNVVPYSAFKSKDAGDNLESALMKIGRKI
jgi:hypothetical protein